MAKHEDFLKQVKERAERLSYMYGEDAIKLIAIIEKLKEQRNELVRLISVKEHLQGEIIEWDQELDEIVGQG